MTEQTLYLIQYIADTYIPIGEPPSEVEYWLESKVLKIERIKISEDLLDIIWEELCDLLEISTETFIPIYNLTEKDIEEWFDTRISEEDRKDIRELLAEAKELALEWKRKKIDLISLYHPEEINYESNYRELDEEYKKAREYFKVSASELAVELWDALEKHRNGKASNAWLIGKILAKLYELREEDD